MDTAKQDRNISDKTVVKRGKTKKLDIAHSGVSKLPSATTVGANFVTVAEVVNFTVNLHF